jgi:hypothetical protein
VKAKELYRLLEAELKPVLTAHGFRKQRASRLVFQRSVGDVYHSVWFQTGKYGWDSYAGGEFYVNFDISETPEVESVRRRDERLNYFLTDAELVSAREYQNAIVARIPKPPESYFEALQAAFGKSTSAESAATLITTVRGYFEPESMPFRRHQDFALRYWEAADIKGWATLISSVIPRALEQMQSWTLPTLHST